MGVGARAAWKGPVGESRSYLSGSRQGLGGLLQTLAPPQTGQTLGEGRPELEAGWEVGRVSQPRWGS